MEHQTRRKALKSLSAVAGSSFLQTPSFAMETNPTPFVLRQSETRFNEVYNVMGMDKFLKISEKDTNGQLSLFFGYYVKNDSAPMHVHYKEDEQFYVLNGEVLFQVGDDRHTLNAGDLVFLPRNIPHTYLVLSDTATMLFMTTPSGKTEAFFKTLSQLKSRPSPEQMQQFFKDHDLGLVGPPLTR